MFISFYCLTLKLLLLINKNPVTVPLYMHYFGDCRSKDQLTLLKGGFVGPVSFTISTLAVSFTSLRVRNCKYPKATMIVTLTKMQLF